VSLIIYRAVPISLALGLHPGASLEVLAGAYVEAHKYSQALPLYEEVLSLRLSTFGHNHKEIAAIYCDFGDLYAHQNQLTRAESCYRLALGIATGLLGDKGSGRAYTRLADCLRDQGRFDEATMQYQNAYDMRAHQFGRNSAKVAETLAEWAKMLKLQGRVQQAQSMQGRVELIQNQHREPSPMWGALFSLTILVLSLLGSNFLLGRKGLLTELVVAKMKAAVDAASASGLEAISSSPAKSLSRSQVSRLVTLYRFQRKDDEAEHYSALLLSMGKD
jgi:tetratricopeptide (TPR) repeat protein